MLQKLFTLFLAIVVAATAASSNTSALQVCNALKHNYNDLSCCGGDPDKTSLCASKGIDAQIEGITVRVDHAASTNTYTSMVNSSLLLSDDTSSSVYAWKIFSEGSTGVPNSGGAQRYPVIDTRLEADYLQPPHAINVVVDAGGTPTTFKVRVNDSSVWNSAGASIKSEMMVRSSTLQTLPPTAQCTDSNAFATGVFGADCAGIASFCNDPAYAGLIRAFCPVTCNVCGEYCSDNDDAMTIWNSQNPTFPSTCAHAQHSWHARLFEGQRSMNDGVFVLACGGPTSNSGKCTHQYTDQPPSRRGMQSGMHLTLRTDGTFRLGGN